MQNQIAIFDSSKNKSSIPIFSKINISVFFLLVLVMLFLYLYFSGINFEEGFFGYLTIGVIAFYLILCLISKFIDKQAVKIILDANTITIYYKTLFTENQNIWSLNSTEIELFELKNHKAQFEGFQIHFKNKVKNTKIKLSGDKWTCSDFENIYTEFKKKKIELIPDREAEVFRGLQIINNTVGNK